MTIFIVLLVIFELLIVGWTWGEENILAFNISHITPDAKDLTPNGDALLGSGFVTLTSGGWESDFCTNLICKGQVFYSTSAKILPNSEVSSFSTKFTFSMIKSRVNETTGDGLVFFLGKHPMFVRGEAYGHFGLFANDSVTTTKVEQNPFFGIEFDTMMDLDLHDQDDNHLGVDINSAISAQVATSNAINVTLNDGGKIISWIDWNKTQNLLEIRIKYDFENVQKPVEPLFSYAYNLNISTWDEFWTGFSSSSSIGFEQRHLIHDWSFKANFEGPPPPGPESGSNGTSVARLIAYIIAGIAASIIVWCFIVKFTNCGKRQHTKCMKLLPSKCYKKEKLFPKKGGKVEDDDEKPKSSVVAHITDDENEDQEDEDNEDEEARGEEEDKENSDKLLPSPLFNNTPLSHQGRMLNPPSQSKIRLPPLTPPKSMHSSLPRSKMKQSHPPKSKMMHPSSTSSVF